MILTSKILASILAMITTKFYLDCRAVKKGNPAPLKIAITKKGVTAHIPLNVSLLPNQWDNKTQKIKDHPKKQNLNLFINKRKSLVDDIILKLIDRGDISGFRACQIKDAILVELDPKETSDFKERTFLHRFKKFTDTKSGKTKEIYESTYKKICDFSKKNGPLLMFEDINKDWLVRFENSMAKASMSKNSRNIHLRNIRAVFNDAIDNEITTAYPFRKFKIKAVETRKRSLKVEDLRTIFTCKVERYAEFYRDMFKLIFFLIGINVIDLYNLKGITKDGTIEYRRAKTNKLYSIKVEPEALEIINKYKGCSRLLNISERWDDYKNFARQTNHALQLIGAKRTGLGGKKSEGMFPDLTTYWARHSWATIAASLDIPKETIAAALGHEIGCSTTSIYINYDMSKVDIANRAVIDWVLYNKHP